MGIDGHSDGNGACGGEEQKIVKGLVVNLFVLAVFSSPSHPS